MYTIPVLCATSGFVLQQRQQQTLLPPTFRPKNAITTVSISSCPSPLKMTIIPYITISFPVFKHVIFYLSRSPSHRKHRHTHPERRPKCRAAAFGSVHTCTHTHSIEPNRDEAWIWKSLDEISNGIEFLNQTEWADAVGNKVNYERNEKGAREQLRRKCPPYNDEEKTRKNNGQMK